MSEQPAGGFFGRWSRRKADAREGKAPAVPDVAAPPPATPAPPGPTHPSTPSAMPAPSSAPPAPTLDDVTQLTPESDYSAFVARHVTSDVKNAAMKKLFTDPHFNVMDGLDVYIDDYSQPDPLAPAMLRQMASAKFLKLVDEDPAPHAKAPAGDSRDAAAHKSVAQSGPDTVRADTGRIDIAHTDAPLSDPTSRPDHDDTDLRLQPDPAAGRTDAGSEPV